MTRQSRQFALTLLLGGAGSLGAQGAIQAAPSGRATTEVSLFYADSAARATSPGFHIRIEYGQPSLRGRALLTDSLVPYDKVWRTGANASTKLTTDRDLLIGGSTVPRGTYVLETLPSRTGWKLLVQRDVKQSPAAAATTYDPANDVARIDLRQGTLATPLETFTIWLVPARSTGAPHGELRMEWGTVTLVTDWSAK